MQVSEPDSGRIQDSLPELYKEPFGPQPGVGWSRSGTSAPAATRPATWWLHILLFALTLVTTTVFGFALKTSFLAAHPLSEEFLVEGYRSLFHGDWAVWTGLAYSVPLLLILLAHELGHYETCRRWNVDASLPYFGPAPTLLGTIGAFIRIRSPIYSRNSLFDIGVSGPLAGFAFLLPFLLLGVCMSHVVPGIGSQGPFTFGTPLLLRLVERLRFPGVATADIALHPTAVAAWAGLLATAINLLPVGQLDGGHISYAVWGERGHRLVSWLLIAALAVAGFVYWPWWLWAVAMFFFRRHPLIYDTQPLGPGRRKLAGLALLLFIISMCIVPVR